MIRRIYIENFKSLQKVSFDFEEHTNIVCLVGKNGAGKSNIFRALTYLYDHIDKSFSEDNIIDNSNPYIQKCVISISFDLHILKSKVKYNPELADRYNDLSEYVSKDNSNVIKLKMTQYKNGTIDFNIPNKKVREAIKNAYPIYYFDTRRLDIYTWDRVWEIINDLSSATTKKNATECNQIIDKAFTDIYGQKYVSSKERIESMFESIGISLDHYHFDSRYSNAFSVRFGGEHFLFEGKPLTYYSDGTNSNKYLSLIISLISQISDISYKYPIILLDEPEIGLHNEYIYEFTQKVTKDVGRKAFLFIGTHSPKLIETFANSKANFYIYRVSKYKLHSSIHKMNLSWLIESTHKATIRETECYFYDYLAYVEGETEIQLFNHYVIRELFEKVKRIHFYSFNSNNQLLKAVRSDSLNLGIPYKIIVDMDKILVYVSKKSHINQHFKIKCDNYINPLKSTSCLNSDKYNFFTDKNDNTLDMRKEIEYLLKNGDSLKPGNSYSDDHNLDKLFYLTIKYCTKYNVIVNWSTIEGELITYENIDKFKKFLNHFQIPNNYVSQHTNILSVTDPKERTILLMLEFNGKTETQSSAKLNGKNVNPVIEKVSGWIEAWLDYYYSTYLAPLPTLSQKREQFKKDFPSLFRTLQILESMV